MTDKEKLSLIVFSGDFDKAIAAFTLATGAAATNREVNLFFTFCDPYCSRVQFNGNRERHLNGVLGHG